MKYIVAFVGAVFMFVATFVLMMIIVAFVPLLAMPIQMGPLRIANAVVIVVPPLAAWASYRATIKRYEAKESSQAAGASRAEKDAMG